MDLPPPAVRTTCAYCGVGCGVLASVDQRGRVSVTGDPAHPANFGRLCAKGAALGDTLIADGRLLRPEIGGDSVTWDTAIARVAREFSDVIAEHGPDAVAFYVSGQLLTEDYYVANKLMKGFIGSGNIDTNSRLCMASSVAGHKRAFGEDVVPGVYEDFDVADLVVLVGSNLAWCHPVLHQRLLDARVRRGTAIVVIDPRATATTELCDLHLALKPGSDVALFNGLLRWLARHGLVDRDYLAQHTQGFDGALASADYWQVDQVAGVTGLGAHDIEAFYRLFANHAATTTVYSQGVNQSRAGTDKVNAIINCHLATGRVGRPGAGPFSITGQPNAMGGREVGGLASTLAAHVDFDDADDVDAVRAFWQAPHLATRPGLKAVELFEAVQSGRVRALWIMATNPLVSLPRADRVREALAACPFVVVSDVVRQADTAQCADVLLPALGWAEKDGTVTNSERCVSRQRAVVPGPAGARPDWWIVSRVARRMGFGAAFAYEHPADIFDEYVRMTAQVARAPRRLRLDHLQPRSRADYDALPPQRWPRDAVDEAGRLYGDGCYSTADGRARFVAVDYRRPGSQTDAKRPYVLTSGRLRDQWHTMTRTGLVPRLAGHVAEPYVEMNPADAVHEGIAAASLVVLSSGDERAPLLLRALPSMRVAPGVLYVPMHFSGQYASAARINALFEDHTDPHSGQPELKHTTVAARPYPAAWYAFAVSRSRPADPPCEYWARMRAAGGWRIEMAGRTTLDFAALFRALSGPVVAGATLQSYRDPGAGIERHAALERDQVVAALFVAREPVAVQRTWAAGLLRGPLQDHERAGLLAGREGGAVRRGALICSCNGVDSEAIVDAVRGGHDSVATVGEVTLAGTGCGACRMEIRRLIEQTARGNRAVLARRDAM